MKFTVTLDDLWSGDDWGTTVGELIRDALKAEIRAQMKADLKKDPHLKAVIDAYKHTAMKEALEKLGL